MKVFVNAYLENNLGDDLFFEILNHIVLYLLVS